MTKKTPAKKTAKKTQKQDTNSTTTSTENDSPKESVRLRVDVYVQVGDLEEEFPAELYHHTGASEDRIKNLEKWMRDNIEEQVMGPLKSLIRRARHNHKPTQSDVGDIIAAEAYKAENGDQSPMDILDA